VAQRKTGMSAAQERLARLSGSARPTSEQTPPLPFSLEFPLPPESAASLTDAPADLKGALEAASEQAVPPCIVTPHVTGDVANEVAVTVSVQDPSHVAGDVTSQVASHVTGHVTPLVTGETTSHVTGDLVKHVPSHDEEQVAAQDTFQVVPQLTARVRGRWTPEERAFIERFRKEQRATAAEILRHIVAWYLEQGAPAAPLGKSLAPSGQILVKRETGLKVLDFMTTPAQVAAIKQAAGQLEEAAWMRRAVDAYRVNGPLVKKAD
jgi:hypothetical protein